MAFSVMLDKQGVDWPLGNIVVATPGTPVGIMSLVDPTGKNDPSNPTPGGVAGADEYTSRFNQIMFAGYKAGVSHGLQMNQGNIYVVRLGVGAGTGNRDDLGAIVTVIAPGQVFFLAPSALAKDVFSGYRYFIDADNAGDAAQVTALIF